MARKSIFATSFFGMAARSVFSFGALLLLFPLAAADAFGQDRAAMTAPTVRSAEGFVSVVTQLSDFKPDGTYRIGVAVANPPMPIAEIHLLRNGARIGSLTEFRQGYVSHWWGVDAVSARGFEMTGSELGGGQVTLEIKIPREDLKRHGDLYVFISRDYGSDRFYLEDGATIN